MTGLVAGGCAPPIHVPEDIGVEAGLPPSWFARNERTGADGPTFIGAAGVRVSVFPDGGIALVVGDGPGCERAATMLNADQAKQLCGFLHVLADAGKPPSILDQAREIVHGDREQTHGAPDHNLRAIGGIWTALLRDQLKPGANITPQMVCLLMAGLKLARASNRPSHREHILDTVGYMALMERCGFIDPK